MKKTPLSEQVITEKIAAIFSWQAKPERLYECSRCHKKPEAGTTIYGVNMGSETEKKFVACQDKECVIKGIKEFDPNAQPAKKTYAKWTPPKRTTEERLLDVKEWDSVVIPLIKKAVLETSGGQLNPEGLTFWTNVYLSVWLGDVVTKK